MSREHQIGNLLSAWDGLAESIRRVGAEFERSTMAMQRVLREIAPATRVELKRWAGRERYLRRYHYIGRRRASR
jgi:hypothetical protein